MSDRDAHAAILVDLGAYPRSEDAAHPDDDFVAWEAADVMGKEVSG